MLEECITVDGIPVRVYGRGEADGLLLLGHGGGHGKDSQRFVELAREYARCTGLAVICIDAVDHGDRKPEGVSPGIPPRWHSRALGRMVSDWQTVANSMSAVGPAVAYVGYSMGSIFGIPTVAAMLSVRAAVFVVGGIPDGGGIDDPPLRGLLLESASHLGHAAILMQNKTGDDIFPIGGTQALYDVIPGTKELALSEGGHDDWSPAMLQESVEFLQVHCRP